MMPVSPLLVTIGVFIVELGLYWMAAPRWNFAASTDRTGYQPGAGPRDARQGLQLRWVAGPTTIVFGAGFLAVQLLGTPSGLAARTALSLGMAAVPLTLTFAVAALRPRNVADVAQELLLPILLGAGVFMQFGRLTPDGIAAAGAVSAVAVLILLTFAVWHVIRRWHSTDDLAELYGGEQGYIARAPLVPVRLSALLYIAVLAAMLMLVSIPYINSLIAPE